jgi:predicted transcriptional regulator
MSQNSVDFAGKATIGWGNRGWMEIAEVILRICEQGALKTHIMYQCNLNSKQIRQYLDFLLARGLVAKIQEQEDSKRSVYLTTETGMRFMSAYRELAGIFTTSNEDLRP